MEPINNPNLHEDNGYPPPGIFMYDFIGGEEGRVRLLGFPWNIIKRLTRSDVGVRNSLVVIADMVRQHILPWWDPKRVTLLKNGRAQRVRVFDHDTGSTHDLHFKWCPTSRSFLFRRGWRRNFVRRRGLNEGDVVGLGWDRLTSKFWFTVLHRQGYQDHH